MLLLSHYQQSIGVSLYLMQNTVEVILFDGNELAVGSLRAQHSTVSADRVLGTRYRQTETT